MRIKLEGTSTAEATIKRIGDALKFLEKVYPEILCSGVNLYFNPVDEKGKAISLTNQDDDEIAIMVVADPDKPRKVARKKENADVIPMPDRNEPKLQTNKPVSNRRRAK